MFRLKIFRALLALIFSCLWGTNYLMATVELSRENPYVILIASEIVKESEAHDFPHRNFIVKYTDTPLLSVSTGFNTYTDIIAGLLSDDDLQTKSSLFALCRNYTQIEAAGQNAPIASALINITNCRTNPRSKLLFEGGSISKNFRASPNMLFFIGTLKNLEKLHAETLTFETLQTLISEGIETDITEQLAGKMSAKFARTYSDTCLGVLKSQLNYSLEHDPVLLEMSRRLEQAIDSVYANGTGKHLAAKILGAASLRLQEGDFYVLSQLETFFSGISQQSIEISLSLLSSVPQIISICDTYKRGVEGFEQKRRALLENPIFVCIDSFFKNVDEVAPLVTQPTLIQLTAEIKLMLSAGMLEVKPKTLESIRQEIESSQPEKFTSFQTSYQELVQKLPTWTLKDLKNILILRAEIANSKLVSEILLELARHHKTLNLNNRKDLIGFAHFLESSFN